MSGLHKNLPQGARGCSQPICRMHIQDLERAGHKVLFDLVVHLPNPSFVCTLQSQHHPHCERFRSLNTLSCSGYLWLRMVLQAKA